MLNRLIRARRRVEVPASAMVAGTRVYAIGDIHGRLDLLERMLSRIQDHDAARKPAETSLVFLGDVIDRGPESAGVIELLSRLKQDRPSTRLLLGNHEEMFLGALTGDPRAVRTFCKVGGRETLISYGVTEAQYERMDYAEAGSALIDLVPASHRSFIESFEDMIILGDYIFVHAGIDPAVPVADQKTATLRWIREPFLNHSGRFEKVVVHGHTIHHDVEARANRIGLDTGAYETGKLSAICLEGTEREVIQT